MGQKQSKYDWTTREYRNVEPKNHPIMDLLLTHYSEFDDPAVKNTPRIFAAKFADALAYLSISSIRAIAPISTCYTIGWLFSSLLTSRVMKQLAIKYIPNSIMATKILPMMTLFFRVMRFVQSIFRSIGNFFTYKAFPKVLSYIPFNTSLTTTTTSPSTIIINNNNNNQSTPSNTNTTTTLANITTNIYPIYNKSSPYYNPFPLFSLKGIIYGISSTIRLFWDKILLPKKWGQVILPDQHTLKILSTILTYVLRLYMLLETMFLIYFIYIKGQFDKPSVPTSDLPTASLRRAHLRLLLTNLLDQCPIIYIRKWFYGASVYDIRHKNIVEWIAGSFYNKQIQELSPVEVREIDNTVKYVVSAVGINPLPGYNPNVKCVRFTLDKLNVVHRPLVMYGCTMALGDIVTTYVMKKMGFTYHEGLYVGYWYRPATNTKANQRANQYRILHTYEKDGQLHYDYVPDYNNNNNNNHDDSINTTTTKNNNNNMNNQKFSNHNLVDSIIDNATSASVYGDNNNNITSLPDDYLCDECLDCDICCSYDNNAPSSELKQKTLLLSNLQRQQSNTSQQQKNNNNGNKLKNLSKAERIALLRQMQAPDGTTSRLEVVECPICSKTICNCREKQRYKGYLKINSNNKTNNNNNSSGSGIGSTTGGVDLNNISNGTSNNGLLSPNIIYPPHSASVRSINDNQQNTSEKADGISHPNMSFNNDHNNVNNINTTNITTMGLEDLRLELSNNNNNNNNLNHNTKSYHSHQHHVLTADGVISPIPTQQQLQQNNILQRSGISTNSLQHLNNNNNNVISPSSINQPSPYPTTNNNNITSALSTISTSTSNTTNNNNASKLLMQLENNIYANHEDDAEVIYNDIRNLYPFRYRERKLERYLKKRGLSLIPTATNSRGGNDDHYIEQNNQYSSLLNDSSSSDENNDDDSSSSDDDDDEDEEFNNTNNTSQNQDKYAQHDDMVQLLHDAGMINHLDENNNNNLINKKKIPFENKQILKSPNHNKNHPLNQTTFHRCPHHQQHIKSHNKHYHQQCNHNHNQEQQKQEKEKEEKIKLKKPKADAPFDEQVKYAESVDHGALVFCHGIGVGLIAYAKFLEEMIERYPNKEIFCPTFKFISMSFPSNYVPSCHQIISTIRHMLVSHGHQKAIFFSHSYGTFICSFILRYQPSIVKHVVLIDPVCFSIHSRDSSFNFLSKEIENTQERFLNFIAQREIGVVYTICRKLWWYQAILFDFLIPSGSTVVLSARDTIAPSFMIRNYLQTSAHRIRLMWFDNFAHAGFINSLPAIHQILDCVAPFRVTKLTKLQRVKNHPIHTYCLPPCPASHVFINKYNQENNNKNKNDNTENNDQQNNNNNNASTHSLKLLNEDVDLITCMHLQHHQQNADLQNIQQQHIENIKNSNNSIALSDDNITLSTTTTTTNTQKQQQQIMSKQTDPVIYYARNCSFLPKPDCSGYQIHRTYTMPISQSINTLTPYTRTLTEEEKDDENVKLEILRLQANTGNGGNNDNTTSSSSTTTTGLPKHLRQYDESKMKNIITKYMDIPTPSNFCVDHSGNNVINEWQKWDAYHPSFTHERNVKTGCPITCAAACCYNEYFTCFTTPVRESQLAFAHCKDKIKAASSLSSSSSIEQNNNINTTILNKKVMATITRDLNNNDDNKETK